MIIVIIVVIAITAILYKIDGKCRRRDESETEEINREKGQRRHRGRGGKERQAEGRAERQKGET